MRYRLSIYMLLLLLPIGRSSAGQVERELFSQDDSKVLYAEMGLRDIISFEAFDMAVEGYRSIESKHKDILTLIDFSRPSTKERLYVIDMAARKLLYVTVVAHGRNSGDNYATSFSNQMGSHKSSLGFYRTKGTYIGKHGYSLRLDGLEAGINDNAMDRAIVIHSADYADPSVIESMGRLGRSFGCPALPESVSKNIINTIKEGSILFIYAKDREYMARSEILSPYLVLQRALRLALEQPYYQQQSYRSHYGCDKAAPHTGCVESKETKQPSAEQSTDDTDNNIKQQSLSTALNHQACDPSGRCSDENVP